jgi:hypothetical protein
MFVPEKLQADDVRRRTVFFAAHYLSHRIGGLTSRKYSHLEYLCVAASIPPYFVGAKGSDEHAEAKQMRASCLWMSQGER